MSRVAGLAVPFFDPEERNERFSSKALRPPSSSVSFAFWAMSAVTTSPDWLERSMVLIGSVWSHPFSEFFFLMLKAGHTCVGWYLRGVIAVVPVAIKYGVDGVPLLGEVAAIGKATGGRAALCKKLDGLPSAGVENTALSSTSSPSTVDTKNSGGRIVREGESNLGYTGEMLVAAPLQTGKVTAVAP